MVTKSNKNVHYAGKGNEDKTPELTLKEAQTQIERKIFYFALKQNIRGTFLRITEDVNGRRDHIIVPASGIKQFVKVMEEIADYLEQLDLKALANQQTPEVKE